MVNLQCSFCNLQSIARFESWDRLPARRCSHNDRLEAYPTIHDDGASWNTLLHFRAEQIEDSKVSRIVRILVLFQFKSPSDRDGAGGVIRFYAVN